MKNILKHLAGILVFGGLTAFAQTQPKLALADVSVAPPLAGKLGTPPAAAIPPSPNADVLGMWQGKYLSREVLPGETAALIAKAGGIRLEALLAVNPGLDVRHLHVGQMLNVPESAQFPNVSAWVVTITPAADGSLKASFENTRRNYTCASTSVVKNGTHLKMTFYNDKVRVPDVNTVEGDLSPDLENVQGLWSSRGENGPRSIKFILHRVSGGGGSVATGSAPLVSLMDLTHLLNVRLFDRFKGEQYFNVLGGAELQQAVPPTGQPPNPPYDLGKPNTAAQFQQAGVSYLLVVSVEDFSDQTIEKRRSQALHYQTSVYNGTSTYYRETAFDARFKPRSFYSSQGAVAGGGTVAHAGVNTQGGLDPEVWQQQTIRLTVRCQLFDAATGDLKKSLTAVFPFQRDYTAVAKGQNQLSTADLCEVAAQNVAAWAALLVDDTVFPIKVLAKNPPEVTISRGSEAGLQVGQVFEVCVQGDPIKDPDTGKILGNDIKTVGRVMISQLEPKFSHARVLEDTGIVVGAMLVRKAH